MTEAPGTVIVIDEDPLREFEILWRVYDEYGNYPQDDWGRWKFPSTLHQALRG